MYMFGIERLGHYVLDCIFRLKTYVYFPTCIKKWIARNVPTLSVQNIKPCCTSFNSQHVLQHAIQNNHLKCLTKAFKNGCEWNSDVCNMLMLLNHKECLLYAHLNNCDWDLCICEDIDGNVQECVENGLNIIHDQQDNTSGDKKFGNKPEDNGTVFCDILSVINNENSLLFAHSKGYDWDHCTCSEVDYDIDTCVKNGLYKIHTLPSLVA